MKRILAALCCTVFCLVYATLAHAAKADSYEEDYTKVGFFAMNTLGGDNYQILELATDVLSDVGKNHPLYSVGKKYVKGKNPVFMLVQYLKTTTSITIKSYDIIDTQKFNIVHGAMKYTKFSKTVTFDGYELQLSPEAADNLSKETYSPTVQKKGIIVAAKGAPRQVIMAQFME